MKMSFLDNLKANDTVLLIVTKDQSIEPKEVEEIETKVGKNNVAIKDSSLCKHSLHSLF